MTPERITYYCGKAFNLYINPQEDCQFDDAVKATITAALEEQRKEIIIALQLLPFRTAQGTAYVNRAEMLKSVGGEP